jgi:hypothetical protein
VAAALAGNTLELTSPATAGVLVREPTQTSNWSRG